MKPVPKPTPKRKRKAAATGKVKKLDAAVREIVFNRDRRCVLCGAVDDLQWSHLISRARYRTRWDTRNSAVMCRGCHWKHHKCGPEQFTLWFIETYGLPAYEELYRLAYQPTTPAEKREYIERLCRELSI